MSVSPPPGGALKDCSASGGGPGLMGRKECPASTDPYQTLRWVPVPVGPLTKTRPSGSTPTSGSPNVWMGSTTDGVSNPMPAAWAGATTTASTSRARTGMRVRGAIVAFPHEAGTSAGCAVPDADAPDAPETFGDVVRGRTPVFASLGAGLRLLPPWSSSATHQGALQRDLVPTGRAVE